MGIPTTMKQWESAQDGLENLKQTRVSVPRPSDNEVLVEISTVALNYRDTEVCMGLYAHHKSVNSSPSIVPCSDICGVVVAVGPGSSMWQVGDRVLSIFNQKHLKGQVTEKDMSFGLGLPLPGVLCEYRVFPESSLVKAPNLPDEEACTLPIAAVTAWMALNGMRQLGIWGNKGETVLIQGTGGVSIAGLLLAKAGGANVIITSSSDDKLARAKSLGADHLINYRTRPDWDTEVLSITNGHGVDIIFENGGAQTLSKSFKCVAFGGLINCIGYLSGKMDTNTEPALHTNVLALSRNVTLKGILNGSKERFEDMLRFIEEKKIKMIVDRTFSFDESKDALSYLYKGSHFGKVVVRVT